MEFMKKYFCNPCGYTYDPEKGDPEHGIAPGTAFEDKGHIYISAYYILLCCTSFCIISAMFHMFFGWNMEPIVLYRILFTFFGGLYIQPLPL